MKEYILYQAYGNIDIINECKYSLLRILKTYSYRNMPQIVIYTDQENEIHSLFPDLNIIYHTIDKETIAQWKGSINFEHRVKIEIIKDALKTHEGKIIYCDTDTYCRTTLQNIFDSISPHNVFFHVEEGSINTTSAFKKWRKFLSKKSYEFLQQESSLETVMWNAGVIGLQTSHLALLDKVLYLTDKLYPLFSKHIVEQFAFCYTFQKEGISISASEPFIFHYWNLKEFRILLKKFFIKYKDQPTEDLVVASENILPHPIVAAKLKFKKSGFTTKLADRISGKGWSINKYRV